MSMLFRQLFPDLSMGAGYVEDELKEIAKVDEYKLPVTECVITTPIKQDFIKVDEITQEPEEAFHEMIDKLRAVLKDCGQEYEVKILNHYGVEHISKIPQEQMKKVLVKAFAFREDKIKQQELQG